MEAPEKIYLDSYGSGFSHGFSSKKQHDNDIEYARADVVIEKAATWFANRYQVNGYLDADDIENFKNYMKGE